MEYEAESWVIILTPSIIETWRILSCESLTGDMEDNWSCLALAEIYVLFVGSVSVHEISCQEFVVDNEIVYRNLSLY